MTRAEEILSMIGKEHPICPKCGCANVIYWYNTGHCKCEKCSHDWKHPELNSHDRALKALREMAWEAWKERHNLSGSLCPLEIEKPIFDEWYEKQIKP